jgi:hypothetical protein
MQLTYCKIHETEILEINGEDYSYLYRVRKAESEFARLSLHSPNFKNLIINNGIKDYEIVDTSDNFSSVCKLPKNLNVHTVEPPNFLTDDKILFLSEDKIVKCYNFKNE